ncbi:MAG TPA: hypothetical protein VGI39_28590, partial [Polyangiaceae bacterium]
ACAGAPPPPAGVAPPAADVTACTLPHGFALGSESAGTLATDLDVAQVRVVRDPEKAQSALAIHLNDAARERVKAFTAGHVGEHLTMAVGDKVVSRLVVRDPIASDLLLTGASEADVGEMRAKLCGG